MTCESLIQNSSSYRFCKVSVKQGCLKERKWYKFEVAKNVCLHVSSKTSHQQTSQIPFKDEFVEIPYQRAQCLPTFMSVIEYGVIYIC